MRNPSHLILRPSGYYLRVAVPLTLRRLIGRTELVRPLGASTRRHALRRAAVSASKVLMLFDALLSGLMPTLAPEAIRALLEQYIRDSLAEFEEDYRTRPARSTEEASFAVGLYDDRLNELDHARQTGEPQIVRRETEALIAAHGLGLSKGSADYRVLALQVLEAELLSGAIMRARLQGDFTAERELRLVAFGGDAGSKPDVPAQPSMLLSVAGAQYREINDRAGRIVPKTLAKDRAVFRDFLEIVGDKPINDYTKADLRLYRDTALRLPSNRTKFPKYDGRPVEELLDLPGVRLLAPQTVKAYLDRLKAFWSWAVSEDIAASNIAAGMAVANSKTRQRSPFEASDLSTIFLSVHFAPWARMKSWRYWLPLLSLYTGAREGELIQLECADVKRDGDLWYIDISEVAHDGEQKKLKSDAARRQVPLHAVLIEKGFIAFAEHVGRLGKGRLFFDYLDDAEDPAGGVSKAFTAYLQKCGVHVPNSKVFHSFRHTAINCLRQSNVGEEVISAIVGHEHNSVTSRYGKAHSPRTLSHSIALLQYAFDVDRIAPFDCDRYPALRLPRR